MAGDIAGSDVDRYPCGIMRRPLGAELTSQAGECPGGVAEERRDAYIPLSWEGLRSPPAQEVCDVCVFLFFGCSQLAQALTGDDFSNRIGDVLGGKGRWQVP